MSKTLHFKPNGTDSSYIGSVGQKPRYAFHKAGYSHQFNRLPMEKTTDLFSHTTVLLEEAVNALAIHADGFYVDGTWGGGGHGKRILSRLSKKGKLLAFDRDHSVKPGINDDRLIFKHAPFSELSSTLKSLGVEKIDGALFDFGISSVQLDNPDRGMSFQSEGLLDMRMNKEDTEAKTAADFINGSSEKELANIIWLYGDERFSRKIARAIVEKRKANPVRTTLELAGIVSSVVKTREPGKHPATRTFQAIRIAVNQELEEIKKVLPQCEAHLKKGGRLVSISFHSLEDRLVKQYIATSGLQNLPKKLPIKADKITDPVFKKIGKVITASEQEVHHNPRARSAKMRIAEKT